MIPNAWQGFDFGLGEDIDMLRETVRSFCDDKIAPRAAEIDRTNEFPRELWPQMGALGLHGITVEEEYGGAAWAISPTASRWKKSRAARPRSACPTARIRTCASTRSGGTAATPSAKYLPKLISGEHVGALAMSEPGAGSDVVSMRTRADKKGDRYVLNGSKFWITNGPEAETLVVYAKTDPNAGARGITAFLIEKGMKGFSTAQKLDKLGMRGSDTGELVFQDCEVPEENVLGTVGGGVNVLMSGLDYERVVLAAGPLGIMQAAMDVVIPYVHERKQFGQPIGSFQLMQGKLADMYVEHERGQGLRVRRGARLRRRPHHARGCRRRDPLCRREGDAARARSHPVPRRQRLHQRISDRAAAARRQALRDRRGHQRNPPHADRPRNLRENQLRVGHWPTDAMA